MAGTRAVSYSTVQDMMNPKVTYSAARTWGELKAENEDIRAKSVGMKGYVRTGQGYDLSADSTILPEGDFSFTFVVNKNESGNPSRG